MKEPFTAEEQLVMDNLIKAHSDFIKLERTHPDEMREWVDAFHNLQNVLGWRILRREYPNHFTTIKK